MRLEDRLVEGQSLSERRGVWPRLVQEIRDLCVDEVCEHSQKLCSRSDVVTLSFHERGPDLLDLLPYDFQRIRGLLVAKPGALFDLVVILLELEVYVGLASLFFDLVHQIVEILSYIFDNLWSVRLLFDLHLLLEVWFLRQF